MSLASDSESIGAPPRKPPSCPSVAMDSSHTSRLEQILQRIQDEQCAYVGIYKPGEFGRETWRAVLLNAHRRGRGHKGRRESVVLSTLGREGIDQLVNKVKEMPGPKAVRHIVNPHCDQDEGPRIVWSEHEEGEVGDWSRRDRMMREGKTVQAEEKTEVDVDQDQDPDQEGQEQVDWPVHIGPFPQGLWDNTVWTSLRSPE